MALLNVLDHIPEHHFSRMVSEFAWPENSIVNEVAPQMFVPFVGSKMTQVDTDEFYRANLTEWTIGADVVTEEVTGEQVTLSTAFFKVGEYAYKWNRQQLQLTGQDPALEDVGAVNRLLAKVRTGIEAKIFAALKDETNFTNNSTPADWATPASATPLADMQSAIDTLTGYVVPNTLVIGAKALTLVKQTDEYTGLFKQVLPIEGNTVAAIIGRYLEIPNVYVVGGQYIADHGIAAADLFGYNALLCHVDPTIKGNFMFGGTMPANMFVCNGQAIQGVKPAEIEEIPGKGGQTLYTVEAYSKLNFVNELLGYLLYDVNA